MNVETCLPMTGEGAENPLDRIDRLTHLVDNGCASLADRQRCPHLDLEYPGLICTLE